MQLLFFWVPVGHLRT